MLNTAPNATLSVQANSRLHLHFRLSVRDGNVVDDTFGGEPVIVTLGENELLPSIETRLIGAHVGDDIRIELAPLQAFGFLSPQRVFRLPRDQFAADQELKPDSVVSFDMPNGDEVAGSVIDSDDQWVTVDFNHPLAGQHVVYEFKILQIG